MMLRQWIGMLVLASLLVPTLAIGQEAPVPLPRRADRMPAGIEAAPSAPAATTTDEAAADEVPEAAPDVAAAAAEAAAQIAAITTPQPVTLVAKITEQGGTLPDGVTWRVFETKTDASGDLILAKKSEDATAHMELAPGNYVVHVAYGRAQTTDTLTVAEGENNKQLVLDAGAMRLSALATGDVAIPINLLRFDIYTSGNEGDRTLVAQNLSSNDIVTLNAGTYHIVSYFGDVNAVVRADLRVEPGQLTEATLYHKAAQISFKLVSEAGGEAIADIDWTVKTADGQTVFTNIGAFPSTVLAEGDYLVLAKRGEQVYNREFQVQPGPAKEIEVLTAVY
ncbi:hypothetical protein PRN20_12440 [Devosia sp. ZB163]|uniref:hypothetical protein n=1 Tax=Devosia sp. ZB163 TaxID=3025938 RepID=UPI00235E4D6C|nr:hypothetical protein [Devosia sp. ZB163]MDC9824544.1 hypothetical protein [Devosia sp. ZB163]